MLATTSLFQGFQSIKINDEAKLAQEPSIAEPDKKLLLHSLDNSHRNPVN